MARKNTRKMIATAEVAAILDNPVIAMGENGNRLVEHLTDDTFAAPVDLQSEDEINELMALTGDAEPEAIATSPSMETAEASVAIDHHSQFGSWGGEAVSSAGLSTSFDAIVGAFDDAQVTAKVFEAAAAIDAREAFERDKKGEGHNILKTLANARKVMVTKRAARVLLATSVDPQILNRSVHEGARYNVYAIGKLADVIFGVTEGGAMRNAINLACMRSLFACKREGVPFTLDTAKMAASDKIRTSDAVLKRILIRHTVSESTAPTQASSTMQAFETLGIVTRSGSAKNPTFTLTDTPLVQKLEVMLAA